MVPFPSSEDRRQQMQQIVDDQMENTPMNNGTIQQTSIPIQVNETEFFDAFVRALERYGPTRRWDKIADELNISISDVSFDYHNMPIPSLILFFNVLYVYIFFIAILDSILRLSISTTVG